MAYASWSVVFGEQPSAAKWNILGTNDASFNDGSGIQPTTAITAASGALDLRGSGTNGVALQLRTQNDNSDSITSATTTGVKIQTGWAQIEGNGTSAQSVAVTFPTAFTSILTVCTSLLGLRSSVATTIAGFDTSFTSASTAFNTGARSITTTGFSGLINRSNGTFGAGTYYGISWIAFGT